MCECVGTCVNIYYLYAYVDVLHTVFLFMCRYHHNAYFMQQAGVVIRNVEMAMSSDFVNYMEMVFSNQESKLLLEYLTGINFW